MTKAKEPPMGAHITETGYPKDYQLRRRIEQLIVQLEKRRREGNAPLKRHTVELQAISDEIGKYRNVPLAREK
jgi:hypothetical protein